LDLLVLRDIQKQPAISQVPRMREWVDGLMMKVDTGDQVVCTVGQADGHSSPDHTTSRADVQWDRIGPSPATLLMPLKGLTGSIMVLRDLTGLKTGCL